METKLDESEEALNVFLGLQALRDLQRVLPFDVDEAVVQG